MDDLISNMTKAELENALITTRQETEWLRACIDQQLQIFRKPRFVPCRIEISQPVYESGGFLKLSPGEHDCQSNPWGAIKIPLPDGAFIGVRPNECVVLRMTENPHAKEPQ